MPLPHDTYRRLSRKVVAERVQQATNVQERSSDRGMILIGILTMFEAEGKEAIVQMKVHVRPQYVNSPFLKHLQYP